jgi:hypothetical protein
MKIGNGSAQQLGTTAQQWESFVPLLQQDGLKNYLSKYFGL